jgi:acyl-CoA reductase-like NAD-dependent aldehyde dehydrogenase
VNDFDEAIDFVNARDHPLALYIFTEDSKLKEKGNVIDRALQNHPLTRVSQSSATLAAAVVSVMRSFCKFPVR